jgi:fructokinase
MRYKWGIDLGGTKIEGVVIDANKNLSIVKRLRVPTEQVKGYQHILNQIVLLIDRLKEETGLNPEKIGMGTPGTLDPISGALKNSNTLCLIGKTIQKDIEALVKVPFVLSNDANCFAVAETKMGVVKDLDYMPEIIFGVIMGTGVGGGLVVHGKIVNGIHGIGGEWGHNVLDPNGVECYCGKIGCVEKVISGPSLERFYKETSGNQLSLREIHKKHIDGSDPAATETINHLVSNFGKAISALINIIDPDVIILGGGVNNIPEVAENAAQASLPHVFNNEVRTTFLRPKLGDSAGVFGAALLV